MATAVNLFPRRVGIIVRKGNPKGLSTPASLGNKGINVLNVQLEKMELFQTAAREARTIVRSVVTARTGEPRGSWNAISRPGSATGRGI
jgi:hypothetical protein